RISALRVISRTSVMQYKHKREALPRIANELGVDGVIEGTVFRSEESLRITVKLIQASTDTSLWSETYQRAAGDVLQVQSELANEIAGRIRVTLTQREREHLSAVTHVDPRAQDAYLKGWAHLEQFTPEGAQAAVNDFLTAV